MEQINAFWNEEDMNAMLARDKNELPQKYRELKSKSAQIRAMTADGYKPSAICKLLKYDDGRDLRPQHVHGVLSQPLKRK